MVNIKQPTAEKLPRATDPNAPQRKEDHILLCRDQPVESSDRFTGFSNIFLEPCAWPVSNDVELEREFLNQSFAAPLLVTGMTGGIERGNEINRNIAEACETMRLPMGLGSQRIGIDHPERAEIFGVKKHFPKLFVIGNIGFSQLKSETQALEMCKRVIEMADADALAIHFNLMQELSQPEGDRSFALSEDILSKICQNLGRPVIAKEVGCGVDLKSAERFIRSGVSAIDVGGRGGTSWPWIESYRSRKKVDSPPRDVFRNWGIPTAFALHALSSCEIPLIATGGIRSGLDVAKAVGLGAQMVGVGLPVFQAALMSAEAVHEVLSLFVREYQISLLASGCHSADDLKAKIHWEGPSAFRKIK